MNKDITVKISKDGKITVNASGFSQDEIRSLRSDLSEIIGPIFDLVEDIPDPPFPKVLIQEEVSKLKIK